jgi:hypothetical protein
MARAIVLAQAYVPGAARQRVNVAQPARPADLRRLRAGRYQVLYEVTEDAVAIRHIARGSAGI